MDGRDSITHDEIRTKDVQRNQCWAVRIKQARGIVLVKVMDVDDASVVLRALNNIDLIARFARTDVEFVSQIEF